MSLKWVWLLQLISNARRKKTPTPNSWIPSYYRSGKQRVVGVGVERSDKLSHLKQVLKPNRAHSVFPRWPRAAAICQPSLAHFELRESQRWLHVVFPNLAAMLGHVIPPSIFSSVNYFKPKVQLHFITVADICSCNRPTHKCEPSELNDSQQKMEILGNCMWHYQMLSRTMRGLGCSSGTH